MKELKALIQVKKIIALLITITLVYLSVVEKIAPGEFIPLATMVIGYYFGQSTAKEVR